MQLCKDAYTLTYKGKERQICFLYTFALQQQFISLTANFQNKQSINDRMIPSQKS
uniref:Uncharacterized protein n=1 Tax=Rhizophora mucronata TaxID=61149 RepID=A0A2P2N0B9_RHIMU